MSARTSEGVIGSQFNREGLLFGGPLKALSRPSWSRRLPRPLNIPGLITLRTLGDVRTLIERHMPKEFRDKSTWRHVAAELEAAAGGADVDDVAVALQLVLMLERVKCVPR
jgi:hypothetical protein